MLIDTFQNLALVEFEQASNEATELAERIRTCGRAGASNAEMVKLLKAWQAARDAARNSHDRLLANSATPARKGTTRLARVH